MSIKGYTDLYWCDSCRRETSKEKLVLCISPFSPLGGKYKEHAEFLCQPCFIKQKNYNKKYYGK